MTPNAYLSYSIQRKCYQRIAWLISLFTLTKESEAQKAQHYPGKLVREPYGLFVVLDNGELEKIDVAPQKREAPLFTVTDSLTITPAWIPSLQEPEVETTLGVLLINLICLYEAFGKKLPYYNKRNFTPSKIEEIIAPRLQSDPEEVMQQGRPVPYRPVEDDQFYVYELIKFSEGVQMLEILSQIFAHSITRIGILPAPGRKEFKAKILKNYEGKLTDPVEMAKFEAELNTFDDAYLKQDPAYGKFMAEKPKKARMKSYLTQGGESNTFIGEMKLTPIVQALEDGIPMDPDGFTAVSNTSRYGSYARGAETVNGGVTAKALMRSADNWRITPGDCETPLGVRHLYRGSDTKQLVGRYILVNKKPVLIEDVQAATAYDSREVIVRSPQYCRREGTQTCEVCAGKALSKYPTGLPIPLMEVSGGILLDSLKLMHNTALVTVTVHLPSVIT